jgi:uncharacterized lipoprotein YddW (UPF0748 family)
MAKEFHLATWAHSVSNFGGDSDEVKQHVGRLADAGFELIIPCVKNPPGYADFRTDVAEVNPSYPDWDPLKVLAESATQHKMKVHPWFCVFPEGEHSRLMNQSPHLAAVFESADRRWACACRPEAQEYELALYKSVADGYPVHGLHLDYIRTGGLCRCDYCKEQMSSRGVDIEAVDRRDPGYAEWVDWRCQRVTSFVEQMRKLTRSKNIELSAAVFSDIPSCRNSNGQDWGEWAEKDLVDFMFPMNYDNSVRNVTLRTRQHVAVVNGHCPVWEGLGKASSASRLTTEVMMEQIRTARQEGAVGVVLFHYPALSDEDLAALKALR